MSGMCKSDARQNTKNKNKFLAKANQQTWVTHKAKRAKRNVKIEAKQAEKIVRRKAAGKPMRGAARAARRAAI